MNEKEHRWRRFTCTCGHLRPIGMFPFLSERHRSALTEMLEQWVSEGFRPPPYKAEEYDIFEALGVTNHLYDTKRPGSTTAAEEFERQYAARSGVSVKWLRQQGRVVRPCQCDYEECEGWQSVNREDWEQDRRFRGRH